jgi:hypothetical protein
MNQTQATPRINGLQIGALVAAGLGIVLCVLLVLLLENGVEQFYQSYLMAYIFWFGLGLGSMALVMIHHLSAGKWGFTVRRLLEAGGMTLPLMALLFVPIVLGMNEIYFRWLDPEYYAGDPLILHKGDYLSQQWFIIRAIIYFVIWTLLAVMLFKFSADQDKAPDGEFKANWRLRAVSGVGLVLYVITMTLASVDWGMSIEPHFFSTMYGVLYMVGQGLSTFAFLIIILTLIGKDPPLDQVVGPNRIHSIGKLLLAFTVLWTYVSYGQFVIIWSGNLPEFTPWYIARSENGWNIVAISLILLQFAVPFFLLLSRPLKRRLSVLWLVAVLIVIMRMVDIFWWIAPDFSDTGLYFNPLYITNHIALGGIWLAAFAWILKRRPLLPLNDMRNDPRVQKGHAHA